MNDAERDLYQRQGRGLDAGAVWLIIISVIAAIISAGIWLGSTSLIVFGVLLICLMCLDLGIVPGVMAILSALYLFSAFLMWIGGA